jgi:deoxyribodipyrimidine photo-lyase
MSPSTPTKILVYLLRHDLRYSDNPVLHEIQREFEFGSSPFTHLLPIYVFQSHQVEISGFIPVGDEAAPALQSPYPEARSRVAGFWRCGPHRAKFLAESVWDLKNTLEQKGSRLVIRVGQVTDVLQDVFRHVSEADGPSGKAPTSAPGQQIVAVWMTKDDGLEEREEENAIQKLVEASGSEFRSFQDGKYYVHEYGSLLSIIFGGRIHYHLTLPPCPLYRLTLFCMMIHVRIPIPLPHYHSCVVRNLIQGQRRLTI